MSKKIVVLLFASIFQISHCQKLRQEIQNLVDDIEKANNLTSEFINYGGEKSSQFERFKLLDSLANYDELVELMGHKSPIVICAAFHPLCRLDKEKSKGIVLSHLHDYRILNIKSGCIGYSSKLGDEILKTFIYSNYNDSISGNAEFISSVNKSILEDSSSELDYKSYLIRNIEITEQNYPLLKKIVIEKKYPESIIQLAKFNKDQDIALISSYFGDDETETQAIHATKQFPNREFFPLLVTAFKKEWRHSHYSYPKWRVLYQALAMYPDQEETIKLFKKTISVKNEFRRKTLGKYLLMAITKHPNSKFNQFKEPLNQYDQNIFFQEEMELD